jgi:hypothetical protein
MAFLEPFDAAPSDQERARLFYQWLGTSWRDLFSELRLRRPILKVPELAGIPSLSVVTRWSDVVDTLSRAWTFQVPYCPKMNPSVGPFMLGRDESELNWRDKSVMRTLLRLDDLPVIRDCAGRAAVAALAGRADPFSVDLPKVVSRL